MRWQKIINGLKAQDRIEQLTNKEQIDQEYKKYRIRTMYSMIIGYAAFYFVRKNFSMAMPSFLTEFHYTKTDLGIVLSLFSIIYGVGKFLNGMLADLANPRYFMAIGLMGAALVNIFFGMSSTILFLGIFWLLNAWFQSMGWPACARLITHWYAPKELGTMWGIWNSSHQIGGAAILVLAGYLIPHFGWRSAFYIPAIISIILALFIFSKLRDSPESLGLPPIEEYKKNGNGNVIKNESEEANHNFRQTITNHIIKNKLLWYLCAANFFVYIVRIGVLDWAPTFLVEAKGSNLGNAGLKVAAFEIAGIFGALLAGHLSDKTFKGRRGPPNVIFMILVIFCLIYFWKIPAGHEILDAIALIAVGFLIYGPQMLVGVAAADFASKKAAATATGLTGTFGYFGSSVCGIGTGLIVDKWGWNGGFIFFIASAILGTLFFLLTWNARAASLKEIDNN